MSIPDFIEKAIEGGWPEAKFASQHLNLRVVNTDYGAVDMPLDCIFLDPEAWKAVGKARGFKEQKYCASGAGCEWDSQSNHDFACVWKYAQPNVQGLFFGLGEALWDGGTIESYLATI